MHSAHTDISALSDEVLLKVMQYAPSSFTLALVSAYWQNLAFDKDLLRGERAQQMLYGAAKHGKEKIIQQILPHVDLNKPNKENKTALELAAEHGHLNLIKLLITSQNTKRLDIPELLINSINQNHLDVFEYLLNNTNLGQRYLHRALYTAAKLGRFQMVKKLCDPKYHLNANTTSEQVYSPFVIACKEGHKNIIEIFLHQQKANNTIDKNSEGLNFALINRHFELAGLLIEHDIGINLTSLAITNPALHIAITYNKPELVEKLIKHGADVNKANMQGYTPLILAILSLNKYQAEQNKPLIKQSKNLIKLLLETPTIQINKNDIALTHDPKIQELLKLTLRQKAILQEIFPETQSTPANIKEKAERMLNWYLKPGFWHYHNYKTEANKVLSSLKETSNLTYSNFKKVLEEDKKKIPTNSDLYAVHELIKKELKGPRSK